MRSRSLITSYNHTIIQSYGRYYEPIATKYYKSYTKLKGYKTVVEPCGLVINSENLILRATPDGKVVFNGEFVIIEGTSKGHIQRIYVLFLKTFALFLIMKIHINKNHAYCDQIQMSLTLTTQTWCDFVFYTSKGVVIDRNFYDKEH